MTPEKLAAWKEARRKFKLSDCHIQMAIELGMNPRKLGSLGNRDQEPWKEPLPDFIEGIYLKRFKKESPDVVLTIEERSKALEAKKKSKKEGSL